MYEQVTGLERNIGKLMVHNGNWSHGSCVKGPYHGSVCPWPYKTAVYMGYARQLCIWAVLVSCMYGLFVSPTAELESGKRELQKHQEELQRRIEHRFTGTLAGQI